MIRPDPDGFADVPVNRHLGLRLESCGDGTAVVTLAPAPELVQETGVIHGGILASLADTAAVYSLVRGLPDGTWMTSIEFKLNFLRPARPTAGVIRAAASRVRHGRTVGVSDVELLQDGQAVARGLFTYLFLSRPA